jgi:hypothetical protein
MSMWSAYNVLLRGLAYVPVFVRSQVIRAQPKKRLILGSPISTNQDLRALYLCEILDKP